MYHTFFTSHSSFLARVIMGDLPLSSDCLSKLYPFKCWASSKEVARTIFLSVWYDSVRVWTIPPPTLRVDALTILPPILVSLMSGILMHQYIYSAFRKYSHPSTFVTCCCVSASIWNGLNLNVFLTPISTKYPVMTKWKHVLN